MFHVRATSKDRLTTGGFSFVEVLVTAAIVALVFGGLFAAVQAMVALINDSKAKAGATALVTERLEYIRSLQYDDVGTIGAPPFGAIPQNRTILLNNIEYSERVVIRYEDDPADGTGFGGDSNTIITDYKKVKVEYSWKGRNGTSSVALSTNIVPQGIESDAGGGSIRVYINDANVNPVPFAEVTISNSVLATTTLTTQLSDANGQFILSGLPAGAGYNITVTKPGYSTDGTAAATGVLSSPNQPIVSVADSAVTTQYFQIDRVSDLTVATVGQPTYDSFTDSFTDSSLIATSSFTTVSAGSVQLSDTAGVFATSGTLQATSTAPSPLVGWYTARFTANTNVSSNVVVQLLYDDGSGLALVPDTDLSGNSTGFTSSPIDLTGLDVGVYDTLALQAVLTTSDTATTSRVEDWQLEYIETQPNLTGVPITVRGAKSLGTDASSAPVYKFNSSYTTDGSGEVDLSDIEYDVYDVAIDDPTLDVLNVCQRNPLVLAPNTSETMTFTLASIAGELLRVTVTDPAGAPISDADVRLQNGGYDTTQTTNLCGQTYFTGGGLFTADDFNVEVTKSGFTSETATTTVSATSSVTIQISP